MKLLTTKLLAALAATLLLQSSAHALVKRPHPKPVHHPKVLHRPVVHKPHLPFAKGGNGGDAKAKAGNGGKAFGPFAKGGKGGDAKAKAGNGGKATATAGNGGDAN